MNSTAMLILLRRWGIRPDVIAFSDTGGEKPGTYQHIQRLAAWLESAKFPPLTTVRLHKPVAGDSTLEEQCLRLGTLPSRAYGHGTCALRWKKEPQDKLLLQLYPERAKAARRGDASQRLIKALGYDGGEERRIDRHHDEYCDLWYPLFESGMGRMECLRLIESEGLPPPPKSACFYCPSSKKSEVLALYRDHPDLFARAVAMERAAAESGKSHSVEGLGRHWSWEGLVQLDAAKRRTLPERPVESCLMCADEDEDEDEEDEEPKGQLSLFGEGARYNPPVKLQILHRCLDMQGAQ